MMQLKAIFSILLQRFEFELAQPSDSYANDLSKMVVAMKQPCLVRYRRRAQASVATSAVAEVAPEEESQVASATIRVDLDLCQGHAVCLAEAPEVFDIERIDGEDKVVLIDADPDPSLRDKVEKAIRHCPTRALSIASADASKE